MGIISKVKLKAGLSLFIVALMVFLAACGTNSTNSGDNAAGTNQNSQIQQGAQNGGASPEPTAEASADETSYPLAVTDVTGAELVFEQAPVKIVTLAASETETAFAVGAGELVVGVDEWSNYPPEAASISKVGDYKTNIEAVVALEPDLVLASSTMNTEAVEKLRELNVVVYASDPKTYDEVIAKIEEIGKIVNKQGTANEVAEHMRQVKEQVADAVKDAGQKSVLLEFSPGWTVGSGEFLDELLTLAGGLNIAAAGTGWFEINSEEVIAQNPQIIIYPDFGEEKSSILIGIEERPGWEAIDAVKNNQMFAVANDPLVRVGPRLADGLLELAKVIHPELVAP